MMNVGCIYCQKPKYLYLFLVHTTVLVVTYVTNTVHNVKERREVNIEINSVHSPMLIAYWVIIILFVI